MSNEYIPIATAETAYYSPKPSKKWSHDHHYESGRYDIQQMGIPSQQRYVVHNGLDGRKRPNNPMPVT